MERLLSNTMNKSLDTAARKNYGSLASIRDAASTSQLVDVFITNDWPASITSHCSSPGPPPEYENLGSPPLDDIIRKVKPKYHFTARAGLSPKFWEREPFAWDDESGRVTRFVSLGAFGEELNGQKQRVCQPACKDICNDLYFPSGFMRSPSFHQPLQRNDQVISQKIRLWKLLLVHRSGPMKPLKERTSSLEIFTILQSVLGQVCLHSNMQFPPPCYHYIQKRRVGKLANPPSDTSASDANQPRLASARFGGGGSSCNSQHFIDHCPERTKPPEGYLCKICGVPGHLVRDCPTKHAVGDTGGHKPREGYVCRACGSELHYIADCPVANQRGPHGQGGKRRPPKEIGRMPYVLFALSPY